MKYLRHISPKEVITELFDKHYPYDNEGEVLGRHSYKFKTKTPEGKDGESYHVHIRHYEKTGHVAFTDREGAYNNNGRHGHDAHKVLGTVKKVLKDHAEKHGLDSYSFDADKGKEHGSRSAVYKRMARGHSVKVGKSYHSPDAEHIEISTKKTNEELKYTLDKQINIIIEAIATSVKPFTKEETTMKRLRDIVEAVNTDSFKPQAKGEKEFVDLHKVDKTADANGNSDDVFNQTKVTTCSRKKMGEQPTKEDGNIKKLTALQKGVKVVATEEVVSELSKGRLQGYLKDARKEINDPDTDTKTVEKRKKGHLAAILKKNGSSSVKVKATNEEVVSELAKDTLKSYRRQNPKEVEKYDNERISRGVKAATSHLDNDKHGEEAHKSLERFATRKVDNRTKGDALAKSKISTCKEEVEVNELSKGTLTRYLHRAVDDKKGHDHARGFSDGEYTTKADKGASNKTLKKIDKHKGHAIKNGLKRESGIHTAISKLAKGTNEEVEQVEERDKDNKEKKNIFIPKKDRKGKTVVNTFDLRKAMTDDAHGKKRVNEEEATEELTKAQCVKPVDKKINDRATKVSDLASYLASKRYGKTAPKEKVKEEIEVVDELSIKRVNKYTSDAAKDQDDANADKEHFDGTGQTYDADASQNQANKRENGIALANKKLKGSNDVKVPATEAVSADTAHREIGTDALVNNFKTVTPGEGTEKKKKVSVNEALLLIKDITVKEVKVTEAKKAEEKAVIVEAKKTEPKKSMAALSSLMRGGFDGK